MANTNRRYIDKTGKMFIPMNVEGGDWNEHFITTPKLVIIVLVVLSGIIIGMFLADRKSEFTSYLIFYGLWGFISMLLLRYIVFEEKFYYKMYKQLKQSEITTPAIFWDIASIKDTDSGAILTYSDTKIAVIVKLERDTTTGKPDEFFEVHYDAVSDFYREIALRKYSFIQLNIMEQAGNDPRLAELEKVVYKNPNKNIQRLMEMQVGYIKGITRNTLYETDYIMIYTTDLTKVDNIINDAIDIMYKLFDGAYIGFSILGSRDIVEFMKEAYGVKYFDYNEATLEMFKTYGISSSSTFEITGIVYCDGEEQEITQRERDILSKMVFDMTESGQDIKSISLKDTLKTNYKKKRKSDEVDFDSLSHGFTFGISKVEKAGDDTEGETANEEAKLDFHDIEDDDLIDI